MEEKFGKVIYSWIENYCKRHDYHIIDIDWIEKVVHYYTVENTRNKVFNKFNYMETDLFN